jgi:hypothetical protein
LIVFKFHSKEVPLRTYIDEIVDAAESLNYLGTESELVDRILMNLHPDILAQSAFLQRPSSFQELRKLAGHIEEKLAVQVERQRAGVDRIVPSGAEPVPLVVASTMRVSCLVRSPLVGILNAGNVEKWDICTGHVERKSLLRETGRGPAPNFPSPGASNSFFKLRPLDKHPPLWIGLQVGSGIIPALVDTGSQFSCVRSDVWKFLNVPMFTVSLRSAIYLVFWPMVQFVG